MSSTLDLEYEEYKQAGRIWGLVPKERIKKIKFSRVSKEVINQFLSLRDLTSTVSDVLDSLGISGAVPASYLKPIATGQKVVGHAVTIKNIPERKTPTQGYYDKDFIRMSTRDIYYLAEPGDVVVIDTFGNLDISSMGGQSATVAKSRGLAGSIVNGAVRDADTIRNINYPVWSCGITPITGKFRIEAIELNGPVNLHNVVVHPGDLIIADDSGVCVVPFDRIEEVLKAVKSIIEEEEVMRNLIESNAPIEQLRPLYRKRYS
ncbi:MAG: dimethylmenaquinone methyltransferase [Bacillus thermozeamaize]|uniref:Putative 4-hydroxy-4-methyl-2-oxoglutarate aldolase n=1 Tax=Bacillus thermozeamaize TaxID=230954 RepID=A0A1Y3PAA7_9BACI|nr:MAG: dimethylmenaquinone methyltransferase [Bacillus thermozeamaize]